MRRTGQDWQEITTQMRLQVPGEWVLVGTGLKTPALVYTIRGGKSKAFQPAGHYQAKYGRTRYGNCDVLARYVGRDPTMYPDPDKYRDEGPEEVSDYDEALHDLALDLGIEIPLDASPDGTPGGSSESGDQPSDQHKQNDEEYDERWDR